MKYLLFILSFTMSLASLSAQVDWKYQATKWVDDAGSPTPAVISHYNWNEESDIRQGIRINLKATETIDVHVEANNATIKFTHSEGTPSQNNKLRHLSVSVNGGSYQTLYNGSLFSWVPEVTWNCAGCKSPLT